MQTMMSEPLFPIGIDTFKADIDYRDFRAGETIAPGDGVDDHVPSRSTIRAARPATASTLAVGHSPISPTTKGSATITTGALIATAKDTDLLVYDTAYTEDEIEAKKGWGHSTWRDGVRFADAARRKNTSAFFIMRRNTTTTRWTPFWRRRARSGPARSPRGKAWSSGYSHPFIAFGAASGAPYPFNSCR